MRESVIACPAGIFKAPMTTPQSAKRVFVKSYGCQMNVYDAERMTDILDREGYQATTDIDNADLVILNTCHIREKAADKIYSELGRLREMKSLRRESGGDIKIVVAGCVAQAEGKEIIRRAHSVLCLIRAERNIHAPWSKFLMKFNVSLKPVFVKSHC